MIELATVEQAARRTIDQVSPAVVRVIARGRGTSTASGVIIDPHGLVLTAGHVVGGRRSRFIVELPDGSPYPATVIGSVFEGDLDLALLQIDLGESPNAAATDESSDLPFASLAPAASLERGEWILALGHAASISTTGVGDPAARIGRVLATDRASLAIDSPIDAGDSGGPIVDLEGRVVGIASRCGAASWQNLATSIDAIHAWLPSLRDSELDPPSTEAWNGRVTRRSPLKSKRDPSLLADLADATDSTEGLVVEIRDDERLVCLGTVVGRDRVVTKASIFARHTRHPIVVQRRRDSRHTTEVTAIGLDPELDLVLLDAPGIEWPGDQEPTIRRDLVDAGTMILVPGDAGDAAAIGIVARDHDDLRLTDTPDDRPFLGVATQRARERGLLVTTVVPNAPAARAGLRAGDVITAIDGESIAVPTDLPSRLAEQSFGDRLRLDVRRDDQPLQLDVALGVRPDRSRELVPGNTSTGTSRLSSGFGPVHLVDADRPLHAVGGPVVDLDGDLLGWIAARRARTSLVVVPWSRLLDAVAAIEPDATATESRLCSYRVVATEVADSGIGLDAEDAFPDGSTIRRERLGRDGRTTWGQWTRADDALEWTVDIPEAGRFLVRIRAACPTRHAGTPVRFELGEAVADGRINGTDDWTDFQWHDLGVVEVTEAGILTARLEPTARPRRAVCNLESVQLVRVPDPATTDRDDDDPGSENRAP